MSLTNEQLAALVRLIASTTDDPLDCDSCFEQVAEFAETHMAGLSVCDALRAVEQHLHNCGCCRDEFETLLAALRAAGPDCQPLSDAQA